MLCGTLRLCDENSPRKDAKNRKGRKRAPEHVPPDFRAVGWHARFSPIWTITVDKKSGSFLVLRRTLWMHAEPDVFGLSPVCFDTQKGRR